MPLNALNLVYCKFHVAQIIIIEDIDNIIKGALEVFLSVHVPNSKMKKICIKCLFVPLKLHVASRLVAVRFKQHRSVRERTSSSALFGIGRLYKDFRKLKAPLKHQTVPVRSLLKSCGNADRALSGHRTVSGRFNFSLNVPTKYRTGAVKF